MPPVYTHIPHKPRYLNCSINRMPLDKMPTKAKNVEEKSSPEILVNKQILVKDI